MKSLVSTLEQIVWDQIYSNKFNHFSLPYITRIHMKMSSGVHNDYDDDMGIIILKFSQLCIQR